MQEHHTTREATNLWYGLRDTRARPSRRTRSAVVALIPLVAFIVAACAARPTIYPNEYLESVGPDVAKQDVDECLELAKEYVKSGGPGADLATQSATGAVVGAAAGSVGGAIRGSAGQGAGVGAAAGATAGLLHGLFRTQRRPKPVERQFVDQCLRDRGYHPIGWE